MSPRARSGRVSTAGTAFTVVLTLLAGLPSSLAGQICFRGRPEPACGGFTVIEFTGAVRANDKAGPTDESGAFFYWSAGYLGNISRTTALGGAFKLTADSDGHRFGPVFRYRRWLDRHVSLDLAPGVFLGGEDNFVHLKFPSPTVDLAVNYGDWFGLAMGIDALRRSGDALDWQSHFGARFGTWLAPLATVGLGVLLAATW
jgi:hypothetical protein